MRRNITRTTFPSDAGRGGAAGFRPTCMFEAVLFLVVFTIQIYRPWYSVSNSKVINPNTMIYERNATS